MSRHGAAAFAAWLLASTGANAGGWSGGIGVTSDKVYRGLSQSGGHPSLLADLQYRTDAGWAVAAGAAGLRRDDGEVAELTLAGRRAWRWDDDWSTELAATHYHYTGRARPGFYDYDELTAAAGWRGRLFVSVAWSPDTWGRTPTDTGRRRDAAAVEAGWHQPLGHRLSLDAGAGYRHVGASGAGYAYGSVGVGWGAGPFNVYLTRVASQAAARGVAPATVAGGRWSATLLWSF